jgi:hypothetical protein
VAAGKRKSLLLVAEPEIAVLMVYAVARLLPRGGVREQISFSTYETNPDRLCTSIAAIVFHRDTTDLPADRYQRDFVVNTRIDKPPAASVTAAAYVGLVWDQILLKQGLAAAVQVVEACEAGAFKDVPQLDRARAGDDAAQAILNPAANLNAVNWRAAGLEGYLRRRVAQRLAALPAAQLQQLGAATEHRRAALELTASAEGCAAQVGQLIGQLDAAGLEWYLELPSAGPAYVDIALKHYAGALDPNRIVAFLRNRQVAEPRKQKVLPHLTDKLQVGELEEFLRLPEVPDELKKRAVERLSCQLPPKQILPFLQNNDLPVEHRLHALAGAVANVPAEDRLAFLQLPQVENAFKQKLIYQNASQFTGAEALALLEAADVPEDCKRYAVETAGFLDRVGSGELPTLLRLAVVAPEAKNAAITRLTPQIDVPLLVQILTDSGISENCKQHVVDSPALTAKLDSSTLRELLQSEHLPDSCKQALLGNQELSARLAAKDLLILLKGDRLSDVCKCWAFGSAQLVGILSEQQWEELLSNPKISGEVKVAALDNAELLMKIPKHRIGAVLMSLAQHPECGVKAFRTRTLIERLPEDQIVNLLLNQELPEACREVAFDQQLLFERMPGRDLTRLLCATTVSAALKEKTLNFADVFRHIHAPSVLSLLQTDAVPTACKNGIAVAFAEDLPDDDVPHLLALPEIDLAIKQTAFKAHAASLTCRHLAQLLQSEQVPAECKTVVTESDKLLRRAMEEEPVELLQQKHVPVDCRRAIAERLDAATLSPEQIVLVLAVDGVPEDRKRALLARRAGDLGSEDVARLLASPSIPETLKQQALQIRGMLERLEGNHVIWLLGRPHIPDACVEPLVAQLPDRLPLKHVAKIIEQGKVSEKGTQGILRKHLQGKPERIIPLLHSGIPVNWKAWVAEFYLGDLPDADFKPMIANDTVSDFHKGTALNHFLESHERLPANCEDLWVEEMGGAPWRPGPMAELLRQADPATVKTLFDKRRPDFEALLENPPAVQLSLYISLFRAAASSRDETKIEMLVHWGQQLLQWRKAGQYGPDPQHPNHPFLLHRILDALLPHLDRLRPLDERLEESLCDIAAQVLDETKDVFQYQPREVEGRIKLLSSPVVAAMFNEDQKPVAIAWGRVKADLQELGKLEKLKPGELAKRGGTQAWNELRDDLLQQLHAIFPTWAEASRLHVITPLARSYGVAAQQLQHDPLAVPKKTVTSSGAWSDELKRRKQAENRKVFKIVGMVLLAVVLVFILLHPGTRFFLQRLFRNSSQQVVQDDSGVSAGAGRNAGDGAGNPPKDTATGDAVRNPAGSPPITGTADANQAGSGHTTAQGNPPNNVGQSQPAPTTDPALKTTQQPGTPQSTSDPPPPDAQTDGPKAEPIVLRITACLKEPLVIADPVTEPVEFHQENVNIANDFKISHFSLVSLHGLDLINRCLQTHPDDYGGVERLIFDPVKPKEADDTKKQAISVRFARRNGEPAKLLDIQLGEDGLRSILAKEQYDKDGAEAKKMRPVRDLLLDCVIELKTKNEQPKYLSLRRLGEQRVALTNNMATIEIGTLATATRGWQEVRIGEVQLWDQRFNRWEPFGLPTQRDDKTSWVWQSNRPGLFDASFLGLQINEERPGTLAAQLVYTLDHVQLVRNYHRTQLVDYARRSFQGSLADARKRWAIPQELRPDVPLLVFDSGGDVFITDAPEGWKSENFKEGANKLRKRAEEEIQLYKDLVKHEMQTLEEYVTKHQATLGITEQQRDAVFASFEFKIPPQLKPEVGTPYHLNDDDWAKLRDRRPILDAYEQRKTGFWDSFKSILERLPPDVRVIRPSPEATPTMANRFPALAIKLYRIVRAGEIQIHVPVN